MGRKVASATLGGMMRLSTVFVLAVFLLSPASAQGIFDATKFAAELNATLDSKGLDGVSVATTSAVAPTEDIGRAVDTVVNATDYIAEQLCSKKSRPTKLTLHLTAGFNLVFSGETGSQVEWDLEIVCNRT